MKRSPMRLALAAVSAAVLLAGCGKDVVDEPVIGETGASEVNFTASVARTGDAASSRPGSKASVPSNGKVIELKSRDGKIKMQMTHEVLPYIGEMPEGASASLTKGKLINETGPDVIPLPADKVGNTFKVMAWTGTGYFISPYIDVTYNQVTGKWSIALDYKWKRGEVKTFVAYANLSLGAVSVVDPTPAGGQTLTYDVSVVPTASAQKDILMGYYKGDGNDSGTADIRFYHPLTAVKFVAGQIEDITAINSISIKGVYDTGIANQSVDEKGVVSFEWTPAIGSTTEVRQEFSTPIPITGDDKTLGEAFFLIPQDLSTASVEVTINATIKKTGSADPDKVDLTATIDGGSWEAGKINVYTVAYARSIPGALPGEFSVSDDDGATIKKVRFSQGNLRYSDDTWAWSFFDKQYECGPSIYSPGHDTEISLFTWGYDATKSIEPSGDEFVTGYPADDESLIKSEDWGYIFGRKSSIWRTLTSKEWEYLLFTRTVNGGKGAGKSYSLNVRYNDTYGMVLYPDYYNKEPVSGTVSELPWGVVFLPAAGRRNCSSISGVGVDGCYWSSSSRGDGHACMVGFYNEELNLSRASRNFAYSVRLVAESE